MQKDNIFGSASLAQQKQVRRAEFALEGDDKLRVGIAWRAGSHSWLCH